MNTLEILIPDHLELSLGLRNRQELSDEARLLLAVKLFETVVLIDEQKARKIARNVYGLTVVGTARILVELRKAVLIGDLAPLFRDLRNASYWIDQAIVCWALRAVGEGKG